MHEHGLVDRLLRLALAEAQRQGGRLRTVHVRLGALASMSPARLRHDFDHLAREHEGLDVSLVIEEEPERPTGLELTAVELAE